MPDRGAGYPQRCHREDEYVPRPYLKLSWGRLKLSDVERDTIGTSDSDRMAWGP